MLNSGLFAGYFKSIQTLVLISVLLILIVLLTVFTGGEFLQVQSLQAIAFQFPLLGVFTLAQVVPMLTSGIDLSIISIADLSGIIVALILTHLTAWYATPLAVLVGIFVSLILGTVNGFLVAYVEIPPIIATLGTMILIKGLALGITKGYIMAGFPQAFLFVGSGSLLGIPVPFIIFLFLGTLMALILNKTPFGVGAYMFGSNPIATLFSGVSTKSVLFETYTLSGGLAGVASLIMISRFNAAQANYGGSYLLLTVLVCVLGGIDPAGGSGKISELVIAILILQIVATGFNLLGLSSYLATALWGLILLGVIVVNRAFLERAHKF